MPPKGPGFFIGRSKIAQRFDQKETEKRRNALRTENGLQHVEESLLYFVCLVSELGLTIFLTRLFSGSMGGGLAQNIGCKPGTSGKKLCFSSCLIPIALF